ncbi:MAG: HAMP domain-containing protein [Ignavibacteria bacterium]|nr:HAMP domain-containing protein [Ignavibacteria bacterium]
MIKRRLFFQIFPSFLLIILIIVIALSWYVSSSLKSFYLDETSSKLEARANLVREYILKKNLLNSKDLIEECQELAVLSNTRITVVSKNGKVLADSDENPYSMDNHSDRWEIIEALNGRTGTSVRYSYTLNQDMMYLAIPVYEKDVIIAVVRLSFPLIFIEETLWQIQKRIIIGGIIIAILAAFVSFFISRRISRPLERIRKGAERFARGKFDKKLYGRGSVEISSLAETLNTMAKQLDERIRTLSKQRNEQEAMLRSMVEGVIAVDMDERIILINKAAGNFFQISAKDCSKKLISEVIRNTSLQEFIRYALKSNKRTKTEITIFQEKDLVLEIRGSALQDVKGNQIGTLIVMNDITQFRQLESMRSEFVANVSHELKTPITSIKGFVETLQDGEVKDPDKIIQFLDIIAKQTDRMNAIIDDLLKLSRIEQQKESSDIQLSQNKICDIIIGAVQDCKSQTAQKRISINIDCDDNLSANINPLLLRQAIINLVDNSIKYSDTGSNIEITVFEKKKKIVISVRDWGCGISNEHHHRLFERFYRVDKARSHGLGGTGLGLAIVKHIAAIHNGKVSVESEPGNGSTFSIHLPKTNI